MKFLNKLNYMSLLVALMSIGILTSCNEDDNDNDMDDDMPSGSFTAENQLLTNSMLTISSVTMSDDGWVVVHKDNGNGAPMVPDIISVPKYVEAGTQSDVMVEILNGADVEAGDDVWIMLHTDNGVMMEYEFDGANGFDGPILDDNGDVVTSPITISSITETGSFMAEAQTISQNMVMVKSITMSDAGWVVLHQDNGNGGAVVPDIISEPVYVEEGTSTNVMIMLNDNNSFEPVDGENVWIMLHTDDGTLGTYEFDGANNLDGPILDADGNIVVAPVEIMAPMVMVDDQMVTNDQVTIAEVNAAVDGWIVIHNQDMFGGLSNEVVGKTKVMAGSNMNVVVELDDAVTYTTGQSLFAMLHIDEAPIDEYNFPGVDGPEIFGFTANNVVVEEFEVQ